MRFQAQDIREFQITVALGFLHLFTGHRLVRRRRAPNQGAPCPTQFSIGEFTHQLGIAIGDPLRELALEGLAAGRFGMFLIPHGVFLRTQQFEILLHDRLVQTPAHVAVEPMIHVAARHVIVVVAKVREVDTKHILLFSV